jgi:hypothetical protein
MHDNQDKGKSKNRVKEREKKMKIPGGGKIFHTCPDRPWGQPSLLHHGHPFSFGGV